MTLAQIVDAATDRQGITESRQFDEAEEDRLRQMVKADRLRFMKRHRHGSV